MLIFIGSEVMLFAGLISALLVSRASAPFWRPLGQPRLPVAVTGLNTGLLVLSGFTMWRVVRLLRRRDSRRAVRWMTLTSALGAVFLAVQGREWARLIHFGLTMTLSLYGGTFDLIVGAHALHLAAALAGAVVGDGAALARPLRVRSPRPCGVFGSLLTGRSS